ncbi:MAG: response regulator [Desulfobacterales bacterium]
MTKRMLERLGYTVLAASMPDKAISLAKTHPGDIHLLITDVIMPAMNGRDLFECIHDIRPAIKCLFMSGYTAGVIANHGVLDEGEFTSCRNLFRQWIWPAKFARRLKGKDENNNLSHFQNVSVGI